MPSRARARIDLGAIEDNCRRLRAVAQDATLCAVVKGDGYGHGAVPSARAAVAGGAQWLAVATAGEARALREGGVRERVLVLGALSPEELDVALAADADVVAWSHDFARGVAARGGGRLHVKLDTGMGRLGTREPAEATAVVDAIEADPALTVAGLMTHFATADEPDDRSCTSSSSASRPGPCRCAPPAACCTRPTAPPRCASPAASSTSSAAAWRSTASTRSGTTPASTACAPRCG
jgi:alanine racemase